MPAGADLAGHGHMERSRSPVRSHMMCPNGERNDPKVPLIEPIQFQSLCDLAAGDSDFILSVIDAFLPQLMTIPEHLDQALAGDDAEDAAKLAHSLKGSAANVGALDVSELCGSIENAVREGDLAAARPLAEELMTVARETHGAYEAEKARLV